MPSKFTFGSREEVHEGDAQVKQNGSTRKLQQYFCQSHLLIVHPTEPERHCVALGCGPAVCALSKSIFFCRVIIKG